MDWFLVAQGAAETPAAADPGFTAFLVPLGLTMLMFYLVLVLPENKRRKQREELIGAVKKHDKVLTNGGIIGVVTNTDSAETITLRVDDARGTTIEFARSSIVQVIKSKEDLAAAAKDK